MTNQIHGAFVNPVQFCWSFIPPVRTLSYAGRLSRCSTVNHPAAAGAPLVPPSPAGCSAGVLAGSLDRRTNPGPAWFQAFGGDQHALSAGQGGSATTNDRTGAVLPSLVRMVVCRGNSVRILPLGHCFDLPPLLRALINQNNVDLSDVRLHLFILGAAQARIDPGTLPSCAIRESVTACGWAPQGRPRTIAWPCSATRCACAEPPVTRSSRGTTGPNTRGRSPRSSRPHR